MEIRNILQLTLLVVASIVSQVHEVNSAKILSISFASSKSHKNVYQDLLMELARRGHKVTIVTPIKSSPDHANVREIIGLAPDEHVEKQMDFDVFKMKENNEDMNPFTFMIPFFDKYCRLFFKQPHVQDILREKYDLVITSGFLNECILGVLPNFKAPSILIFPFTAPFWSVGTAMGGPMPPSFVPLVFFGFGDKMGFLERAKNFLGVVGMGGVLKYYYYPKMEAVYRENFGPETQSVEEILKNVSLILSNSHFSLNFPRPLLPDVIDVGGMHCRDSKPLPKDLEDFVNGSGKDGFIYFSMGSVVKAKTMAEKYRKLWVNVFSKLKQRVIWKWEGDDMPDLSKNVKLSDWLPQQDILGHKKIKLFITHGGLLSTEEAVYHGVPLLGFPLFGDQGSNMEQAERKGFALSGDFIKISENEVMEKINRLLNEPEFLNKARQLSQLFRDRPIQPLDLAIYWVEYIIRHKGAPHLRSAGRDLNFFQYYSLDVIGALVLVLFTSLYLLYAILRFCIRKICGSNTKKSQAKPNQTKKKQ